MNCYNSQQLFYVKMLIYKYFENKSNANEILLEILSLIKWGMFMEKSVGFLTGKRLILLN